MEIKCTVEELKELLKNENINININIDGNLVAKQILPSKEDIG